MPTQTKIASAIRLLIDYGPYLKPPYIKKLQDKLYELRISGKIGTKQSVAFLKKLAQALNSQVCLRY